MTEEKMHLIYKIFNNETIRTVWDKKEEKYYISVVDIEGMFRIIEPISSKNVEPVKMSLLILLLLCKNLLICIEKGDMMKYGLLKGLL